MRSVIFVIKLLCMYDTMIVNTWLS